MYNDFRFFTPLRCVQNDRMDLLFRSKTLCVSDVNTYRVDELTHAGNSEYGRC